MLPSSAIKRRMSRRDSPMTLPPMALMMIESLVIVASAAGAIFYLLKAMGVWL